MRKLKTIRVLLSVLLFAAACAYLAFGEGVHPLAKYSEKLQIIPSVISVTFGITLFWLAMTFVFGRVYCSSVCPIGTLQDIAIRCRRFLPRLNRPFRFHTAFRFRTEVVILYAICLCTGVVLLPLMIEPWNTMRHIVSVTNPSPQKIELLHFTLGATAGVIAGLVSLVIIVGYALLRGRDYCNTVCPIGIALGSLGSHTLLHIEIDPDKCTSCMRCEDACKASCLKVVSRYVDNSRCVRCFNCVDVCPASAIRYQINRNRVATPMMKKVNGPVSKYNKQ